MESASSVGDSDRHAELVALLAAAVQRRCARRVARTVAVWRVVLRRVTTYVPCAPSRKLSWKTTNPGLPERMNDAELRLFVVCGVVALANLFLFCACGVSLLRVLRVAARDAYSSPRRRLLALDDGVPRRIPGRVMAVLGAFRPFTTQKALLSMLTLSAALSVVWAVLAFEAWDLLLGTLDPTVHMGLRLAFFGTDFLLAATSFTLYTTLARFWADLAFAARQRSGASRPMGGGDEYRPRGSPPLIWKVARAVQHFSSVAAFSAAIVATVVQAIVWGLHSTYVNDWTAYVEAGMYILAAVVMVTTAYYAVVELRLVPIELPTRRRRVFRIVAMTGSVAVCLTLRAAVLVWLANRTIFVNSTWEMLALLGYWGVLVAMPSLIVLAYNRVVPLSTSSYSEGRARSSLCLSRSVPEEEPLIAGTGTAAGSLFDDSNTFASIRPSTNL
ncbi:unnamed protein product [Pylaiella littoralis]